jgi:group II intron reverse transcriptase/maturase
MLPVQAQTYLAMVRKRGEAGKPLNRVLRLIRRPELYLLAYANLYANKGALTPGIDPNDTVDGMSLRRIARITERVKARTYRWSPVRRTYREKKRSSKKRPIGMPGFTDKLLQEVIRLVLEAYYEPQFRDSSHGFRPRRGCHTALDTIARWKGTRWFIEGDITACFDSLDHRVIITILRRKIKDRRFLQLIRGMLRAGYLEQWVHHKTYSGTPQGSGLSPLLANIVLNELDTFIEDELMAQYNRGKARRFNREYIRLSKLEQRARKRGDWTTAKRVRKHYTRLPSRQPNDPGFRRLWYVRYADDFILGFIGTKQEAGVIKQRIGQFLTRSGLSLSDEKTAITHARTEKARFLNYHINLMHDDEKVSSIRTHAIAGRHTRRTINQQLFFSIPHDVTRTWLRKVEEAGKVMQRGELQNQSDYDIITTYEVELQGLLNYYNRVHNLRPLRHLRYVWKESLIKTLAAKYRTTKARIRRKYGQCYSIDGRKLVGVEIGRDKQKPLRAVFGKKPLQRHTQAPIRDDIQTIHINRNELGTRLLAEVCELCGQEDVALVGHHVRKLKDLKKRWQGKEKPAWVRKMIAIRRKSLFMCEECHQKIHAGRYDGKKLTQV